MRESLWRDARRALIRWRLNGEMRQLGLSLDLLGLKKLRRAVVLRRWRGYVRLARTYSLGYLAGDLVVSARSLRCWRALCTDSDTRRVHVPNSIARCLGGIEGAEVGRGSAAPASHTVTTAATTAATTAPTAAMRMVHAKDALALRHRRHHALSRALSDWRYGVLQRHLSTLDTQNAWHPTARRALREWFAEASSCALRSRLLEERSHGNLLLTLALAMLVALRRHRGAPA